MEKDEVDKWSANVIKNEEVNSSNVATVNMFRDRRVSKPSRANEPKISLMKLT